ncbi:1-acyl-sn-glycerol-3-phosphate acyltransferase [Cyclobacterium sp.]|uniref:1-acyl-sn-glycerol-3-phosphate acyltransferase n=1 Tax=Cyclobacterium sp. TaxID=1966343 RepID=UPI0019B5FFAF|nr:1-acyl-sn-glycerol-3-phosphate acyltransferase [Cyclobacterium sp.]MBD3626914.1 1-acyl-sn-glycerol-3-phosphate acyltransferase [Cyclobacterium sp.]
MEDKKFIDIKKVIKEKNPALSKWLPGFVLSYIKRIVHESEVNQIMSKHGDLKELDFVNALIEEFGVEIAICGEENIPRDGSVIFASNHPLGGLDGVVLMHVLGKYRKDLRFLVNDVLMHIPHFGKLFVPVNKHGTHGKKGAEIIEETYASQNGVIVFPAGLVSRKQENGIRDLEWKKSFVNKARKYKKDVVPVYIEGKNSSFFYNLANLRKKIGLKANIEMFYLADEMFGQKNKKIVVHIGKPISYEYFDASKSDKYWAEEVKEIVYKIVQDK